MTQFVSRYLMFPPLAALIWLVFLVFAAEALLERAVLLVTQKFKI